MKRLTDTERARRYARHYTRWWYTKEMVRDADALGVRLQIERAHESGLRMGRKLEREKYK